MVWLTMLPVSEGTDFLNQIFMLESVQTIPVSFILDSDEPVLYLLVYKILYSHIGISPRFYIAILSFVYFSIIFFSVKKVANIYNYCYITPKELSYIAVFTCLCYSPLFICIARFHFAILFVLIGLLLFIFSESSICKIGGVFIGLLAYKAHEGIIIIFTLILLAYVLHKFWLSKNTNYIFRNKIICIISVFLFVLGSHIFKITTKYMVDEALLSNRYSESYVNVDAGDGAYLLVLVLSLFGSILSLFVTILYDRKNNWITAFCVAGWFMFCLYYNQKFFFVQRVFMFMPLFIGLSCMQVLDNFENIKQKYLYIFFLLSVPAIYLCQLFIQRNLFFGG